MTEHYNPTHSWVWVRINSDSIRCRSIIIPWHTSSPEETAGEVGPAKGCEGSFHLLLITEASEDRVQRQLLGHYSSQVSWREGGRYFTQTMQELQ